jgi:hypothetical protein
MAAKGAYIAVPSTSSMKGVLLDCLQKVKQLCKICNCYNARTVEFEFCLSGETLV